MKPDRVVIGQRVDPVKAEKARELRRTMTAAERVLWEALRHHRLNGLHFRRQQVIDGFIVDFYCHAAGVVVEVDGPVHDGQAGYDLERDEILMGRGLRVLRFLNGEVQDSLSHVLDRIAAACAESGANPRD